MPRSITPAKVRLYVEADLAHATEFAASGARAHYLINVMRLKPGDRLLLFNGRDGEWWGHVEATHQAGFTLIVDEQTKEQAAGPDLWLVFAPLRRARLAYLAEKATELGVAALCPVITRHSTVRKLKTARLRANAIEAAEQSDRLTVPEIHEPVKLEALLGGWPADRRILFCDESGEGEPAAGALGSRPGEAEPWAVLVGPEGGFTAEEAARLRALPFVTPIGLGPRLLRAETAVLAALSLWQAHLGDWRD